MGQYHVVVNLDKREYLDAFKLGTGVKLWEQIANHPSTGSALLVLLAVSNGRGGGDLDTEEVEGEKVVGRWGGDRIAVVGDYAERTDLPPEFEAERIYGLCGHDGDEDCAASADRQVFVHALEGERPCYRDITHLVRAVLVKELHLLEEKTDYGAFHLKDPDRVALWEKARRTDALEKALKEIAGSAAKEARRIAGEALKAATTNA